MSSVPPSFFDSAPSPPPSGPAERPLTVGELSRRIVRLLEGQVGQVRVVGEVSNLRAPSSGHCYFVLKDAEAAINAVCFRSSMTRQSLRPIDGMQLEIRGRLTAYPPRSEYQVIVESLREAGVGDLMRRFLELKETLRAEGLFELARKRSVPRLPRTIGIVTSTSGAALRDILNILRRRARGVRIILSPATVQGDAAPADIVRALRLLCRHGEAEVVIVGRGGGSIEDLWAFNDERVVRAIAACAIPVISAVGHETDTTLADYAADLRAPTPSAAAELVSAHYGELAEWQVQLRARLHRAAAYLLGSRRSRLERCRASWGMRDPRERLALTTQRLDDLGEALGAAIGRRLVRRRERLEGLAERLRRATPARALAQLDARLQRARSMLLAVGPARWLPQLAAQRRWNSQLGERLRLATLGHTRRARLRLDGIGCRLEAANPRAILQRGYSIVTHGRRERIVKDPAEVRAGEVVSIQSAGGRWSAAALPAGEDLFEGLE